jgi:hypothetical protein
MKVTRPRIGGVLLSFTLLNNGKLELVDAAMPSLAIFDSMVVAVSLRQGNARYEYVDWTAVNIARFQRRGRVENGRSEGLDVAAD